MGFIGEVAKVLTGGERMGKLLGDLYFNNRVQSSGDYWEHRYCFGGNSGKGSYDKMAKEKARYVNNAMEKYNICEVLDFGCGDGNQLELLNVLAYTGLDVSPSAIKMCITQFPQFSFYVYDPLAFQHCDSRFMSHATMSLDVLMHLIEDEVYEKSMKDLFACAREYVLIHAPSHEAEQDMQMRYRDIKQWVRHNRPDFELVENHYNDRGGVRFHFLVYRRKED